MREDYPVLTRHYGAVEKGLDFWVKEKESPFVEDAPFDWIRGYHVGGRSLMWGRQSYRWSNLDFEANAKDGIAVDWPIRYKDIRSEEHTSELQSLMRNSYAVFCLQK